MHELGGVQKKIVGVELCAPKKKKKKHMLRTSQVVLEVKNLPANAGDVGDMGSIPGFRRSPGEGNGHPLRYSRLENPVNRGA